MAVEGWYRRAPVPSVELRSIARGDKVTKSWVPLWNRLSALALIAAGLAWAAATFFGVQP